QGVTHKIRRYLPAGIENVHEQRFLGTASETRQIGADLFSDALNAMTTKACLGEHHRAAPSIPWHSQRGLKVANDLLAVRGGSIFEELLDAWLELCIVDLLQSVSRGPRHLPTLDL